MEVDSIAHATTRPIDIPESSARSGPSKDIDMNASFVSDKSEDSQEGGVKLILTPRESPKKRSADKISASTSPPLNPAASEFVAPARIEKAAKMEQSADHEGVRALSPRLNPKASNFVAPTADESAANKEELVSEESKQVVSPRLNPAALEFVAPTTKPEDSGVSDVPEEQAIKEPEVKIAVIIKFVLGTSQYATMALRELMKLGGVKTYKPDFSSGR
jgi:hypothetical protein